MTDPDQGAAAQARDEAGDQGGLIEPDGVNASSQDVEDEALAPPPPPTGSERTGGDPSAAESTQHDATQRDEELGPPDQSGVAPGQELSAGEG